MNGLDAVLVTAALGAAVAGWRRGLIVRVLSWVGAAVGVAVALALLPTVMDLMAAGAAENRLVAGLLTFFALAGVGAGLGEILGHRLRHLTADTPVERWDREAGAIAGLLGIAVSIWLLTPAAADVPAIARDVRRSAIVGWIADATPRPPDAVAALRTLVGGTRFPEVFADLRPAPETGPPPESYSLTQETLARVIASTSNVEAFGCGSRFEGSAFTVATDLVVTNAHVVAGAETIQVRRPDGSLRDARVLSFDDDRDLALLQVGDLGQEPLSLTSPVEGTDGAVVGYPGGQDTPRPTTARVEQVQRVVGFDIYGQDRTERLVIYTAAQLRQGDSGSPQVDSNGDVVGVIFAVAPDDPDLAYALHIDELRAFLAEPASGGPGPCT